MALHYIVIVMRKSTENKVIIIIIIIIIIFGIITVGVLCFHFYLFFPVYLFIITGTVFPLISAGPQISAAL